MDAPNGNSHHRRSANVEIEGARWDSSEGSRLPTRRRRAVLNVASACPTERSSA
jgi:hypothetical protein